MILRVTSENVDGLKLFKWSIGGGVELLATISWIPDTDEIIILVFLVLF